MSRINMTIYREFVRLMTSFQMRSDKSLSLKGEKITLYGLNSPYTSHQHIEFEQGHGVAKLIVCDNDVILTDLYSQDNLVKIKNYSEISLPGYLVRNFLADFKSFLPEWIKNSNWITVFIPNKFSGYDENNNPLFNNGYSFEILPTEEGFCSRFLVEVPDWKPESEEPEPEE